MSSSGAGRADKMRMLVASSACPKLSCTREVQKDEIHALFAKVSLCLVPIMCFRNSLDTRHTCLWEALSPAGMRLKILGRQSSISCSGTHDSSYVYIHKLYTCKIHSMSTSDLKTYVYCGKLARLRTLNPTNGPASDASLIAILDADYDTNT